MTRARSIAAIFAGALAWAATTACNQTTINTPLRSFDRPSDVALSCVQYRPDENTADDSRPHGTFEVRPLTDCEPVRSLSLGVDSPYTLPVNYIPPIGPNQPFVPFLLALVPQSARGELALVDTAQEKLIDADPYKPGFGFLPVGKLPEHIRSTTDGCWAMTANTDSCDLTKVDVSEVVHQSQLQLFPQELRQGSIASSGVAQFPLTVPTTDANGKAAVKYLHVRPSWIEMAPPTDGGDTPSTHGYEPGGTPGQCTMGTHHAWVALPACQLVVKVSLEAISTNPPDPSAPAPDPVATITQALHVDKSGVTVVTDLSTIECPVECTGDSPDMSGVDAGPLVAPVPMPTDMGVVNLPTSQAWPAALAVDVESDVVGKQTVGRLIIGDGFGERIDIVPFDVATAAFGTPRAVTLEPGTDGLLQPGVRVVRTGPRSQAGKFLYAVARDATVRVIDLDREVECETNPDPRWGAPALNLQQTPTSTPPLPADAAPQARSLGCFPLGDPSTPRRSPLATSPGITLVQGQLPTDVAFVHIDSPPGDPTGVSLPPPAAPGLMVGDFAWIISSDGRATAINIFDACPAPNQQDANATPGTYTASCILSNVPISLAETVPQFGHPQPMLLDRISHRIRGGHPRFFLPAAESDDTGTPRVIDSTNPCAVAVPATSPGVPDGGVPDAGGCGSTEGNLPSLYREPVPPALQPQPNESRVVYFTDPDHARNETWVMVWEGVLAGTNRALGSPFVVSNNPDPTLNGAYLSDVGGSWCSRGVLKGDKMLLRGCTIDQECDQSAFYQCVHDPGAFTDVTQGMCLPIDNLKGKTSEFWSDTCGKLLRSQRKFRILHARQRQPVPNGFGATSDLLTLGEIYEPEYSEETKICAADSDCVDITVAAQVGGAPQATRCLPDNDGNNRCILPCADVVKDDNCGIDFECAVSTFGDKRCMRAPIGDPSFWSTCMPELQEYEIHVGDAFNIAGTVSGYLSNEVADSTGECIVPPETLEDVRLAQWRIPMSAPACPANVNGQPLAESIDPALQTNICEVASAATGTTVKLVHFENPIFNIVAQFPLGLDGRPIVPPDDTSVSMAVTGGGNNLVAQLGVDVQAQQPRYATVAPDGQTVYVIDEGKSPAATGLRGQLLRLFSGTQSVDSTFIVR